MKTMKPCRHLVFILGDQLDAESSALADFDVIDDVANSALKGLESRDILGLFKAPGRGRLRYLAAQRRKALVYGGEGFDRLALILFNPVDDAVHNVLVGVAGGGRLITADWRRVLLAFGQCRKLLGDVLEAERGVLRNRRRRPGRGG